jgi:hypothetical protein
MGSPRVPFVQTIDNLVSSTSQLFPELWWGMTTYVSYQKILILKPRFFINGIKKGNQTITIREIQIQLHSKNNYPYSMKNCKRPKILCTQKPDKTQKNKSLQFSPMEIHRRLSSVNLSHTNLFQLSLTVGSKHMNG